MGLTLYDPAPTPDDEPSRARAVELSGALGVRDDAVLQALVEKARNSCDTQMAAVSILHNDWQFLIATSGLPGGAYSRRTSFCGHILNEGGGVFCVPDALDDERFAGNPVVEQDGGIRFYAGAPIRDQDQRILGALCVFDSHPRERCPHDVELVLPVLAEEVRRRLLDFAPVPAGLEPT
ncbi:GAF domain-containing protein [Sphingomonas gellani]|uniref:GAF domain-containing protein n=1 Tax=Sphingomonas gellani TaxID=1166340 RepID=A0A1H8B7U3_9SPHN|nr:GAF domain-containing protein [Sphingomonas gellani]SEM78439.1 GAF domain-containing protein [Sphingomonas gellani]